MATTWHVVRRSARCRRQVRACSLLADQPPWHGVERLADLEVASVPTLPVDQVVNWNALRGNGCSASALDRFEHPHRLAAVQGP